MSDLYDYLNWRGDLSLKQAPLNNIDTLILSRVSYLPFAGIVSGNFKERTSLAEAERALAAAGESAHYIMEADRALLPALAACQRFRPMLLSGFVNQVDDRTEKQFSALVVAPGDGTHFISYRGTDDTMTGWKEDFNMSFMTKVPSQLEAVFYLEAAARSLRGKLSLGGHSKGGNLAAYAAAFSRPRVQRRILKVFNYDGPGFHAETLAEPGFAAVRDKIVTIVPQSSVVGLLLEHEENFSIIQSKYSGFMQHDLYSWSVMRDDFIYLDAMTGGSRFVDQTLRAWLGEMSIAERSAFIEGLYSIINATRAKNLRELSARKWYEHARAGLKALIGLDEHTRMVLGKTLLALIAAARGNLHIFLPEFMHRQNGVKKPGVQNGNGDAA